MHLTRLTWKDEGSLGPTYGMTVDVKWIAAKQYLLFETGSHGQCNLDRRQVLGTDQADWWPTEVIKSNTLNSFRRFGGEPFTPKPSNESPFDFRFWPVVWKS
jgi:hypothetical protein